MSTLASTPTGSIPVHRHPGDALSARQRLIYVIVLGALTALGPFTIDLYLPAFPALQSELNVSEAAVQLTLTGTTLGFALGQLVVGPWSDAVGRRLPILLATSLHVLACVGAALAPEIVTLGVFRLLMGAGAAAGGVVAMAMVRDLFGGRPLVRMLSRLALVSGLAPVLAPVIGSQLLLVMDWRGIFVFLAAYGVLVVSAVALLIVETRPRAARHERERTSLVQRYRAVLSDRVFVGVAVIGGMTFAGLFTYLSSSSFLFQGLYGFDAQQYGLLFAVNSLGVVFGVQASSYLSRRIGPQWILAITTVTLFTSAGLIALFDVLGLGLWGTLVPLWFFIASCGFSFPCVQVLGLVNHGREAGTAASLLGAVNFGTAGLLSPISGIFGAASAVPMAVVMMSTAAVSILALWLIVRPRSVPALQD
ncbi:multidrug effflux MFS transporter [Rathayibacter tanaceti]|uniref:DHA1 family bicyclomycin/chloramphenicol resistance-like MFS transporter n=2 Tax=Rathayibacter tanaceti TaxID=1671680 RepID=A0ACD2XLV8_9MICO|nr:multidrug effflux MFS transporter [Rathayibacter tanaceti]KZX21811.1 Bicyclomycin resistance protein [Rathayibacter tanaceti]TCO38415.1 DHA1 family bicyclomycin/chloramphenicol resistance-like MFS transporter [Rathayibacter tanaceti]